jgi:hypothetical protein
LDWGKQAFEAPQAYTPPLAASTLAILQKPGVDAIDHSPLTPTLTENDIPF